MGKLASITLLAMTVGLAGCASAPPVPFSLVDESNNRHVGTFFQDSERVTAQVAGKTFHGYYMVASGSVTTTSVWPRWLGGTGDSYATTRSNSARAYLSADDGEKLSCEFLFEPPRSLGVCKSSKGGIYQLVGEPRR